MSVYSTGTGPVIQGTEHNQTHNDEEISKLVEEQFDICFLPNGEMEIKPLHEYQVVMLGENHGEESCPVYNGKIVDHLAEKWGGDLLLLVEDSFTPGEKGGQASEVKSKVMCQAWGTNSEKLEQYEKMIDEKSDQLGERLDTISGIVDIIEQDDELGPLNAHGQLMDLSSMIEEHFSVVQGYTAMAMETKEERDLHLQDLVSQNSDKKIVIIAGGAHVDAFCDFLEQKGINGAAIDKKIPEKDMPTESVNMQELLERDVKEYAKVLKEKIQENKDMPIKSTVDLTDKYSKQILLLGYAESYFIKVTQS